MPLVLQGDGWMVGALRGLLGGGEGSPFDAPKANFPYATTLLFLLFMGIMLTWELLIGSLSWVLASWMHLKRVLVDRLKDELLALGIVSLIVAFITKPLSKICVDSDEASYDDPATESTDCPEGTESLFPPAVISTSHYLLFWIAVTQIGYTLMSACFTATRFHRVLHWEQAARHTRPMHQGKKRKKDRRFLPSAKDLNKTLPPTAAAVNRAGTWQDVSVVNGHGQPTEAKTLVVADGMGADGSTHGRSAAAIKLQVADSMLSPSQQLVLSPASTERDTDMGSSWWCSLREWWRRALFTAHYVWVLFLGGLCSEVYTSLRKLLLLRVQCDPHSHELRTINLAVASEQLLHQEVSWVHAHTWLQVLFIAALMLFPYESKQVIWVNAPGLAVLIILSLKLQSVTRRAVHIIDTEVPSIIVTTNQGSLPLGRLSQIKTSTGLGRFSVNGFNRLSTTPPTRTSVTPLQRPSVASLPDPTTALPQGPKAPTPQHAGAAATRPAADVTTEAVPVPVCSSMPAAVAGTGGAPDGTAGSGTGQGEGETAAAAESVGVNGRSEPREVGADQREADTGDGAPASGPWQAQDAAAPGAQSDARAEHTDSVVGQEATLRATTRSLSAAKSVSVRQRWQRLQSQTTLRRAPQMHIVNVAQLLTSLHSASGSGVPSTLDSPLDSGPSRRLNAGSGGSGVWNLLPGSPRSNLGQGGLNLSLDPTSPSRVPSPGRGSGRDMKSLGSRSMPLVLEGHMGSQTSSSTAAHPSRTLLQLPSQAPSRGLSAMTRMSSMNSRTGSRLWNNSANRALSTTSLNRSLKYRHLPPPPPLPAPPPVTSPTPQALATAVPIVSEAPVLAQDPGTPKLPASPFTHAGTVSSVMAELTATHTAAHPAPPTGPDQEPGHVAINMDTTDAPDPTTAGLPNPSRSPPTSPLRGELTLGAVATASPTHVTPLATMHSTQPTGHATAWSRLRSALSFTARAAPVHTQSGVQLGTLHHTKLGVGVSTGNPATDTVTAEGSGGGSQFTSGLATTSVASTTTSLTSFHGFVSDRKAEQAFVAADGAEFARTSTQAGGSPGEGSFNGGGRLSGRERPSGLQRLPTMHQNMGAVTQVMELERKIMSLFWFRKPHLMLWLMELVIVCNASVLTICFYHLARYGEGSNPLVSFSVVIILIIYNLLLAVYIGWVVLPQYALLTTAVYTSVKEMLHQLKWANVVAEEEEKGVAGLTYAAFNKVYWTVRQYKRREAQAKRAQKRRERSSVLRQATTDPATTTDVDGGFTEPPRVSRPGVHVVPDSPFAAGAAGLGAEGDAGVPVPSKLQRRVAQAARSQLMKSWVASLAQRAGIILPAEHVVAAQAHLTRHALLFLGIVATWQQMALVAAGLADAPKEGYAVAGGVWLTVFRDAFDELDVDGSGVLHADELQAFLREAFSIRATYNELKAMMWEVASTASTRAYLQRMRQGDAADGSHNTAEGPASSDGHSPHAAVQPTKLPRPPRRGVTFNTIFEGVVAAETAPGAHSDGANNSPTVHQSQRTSAGQAVANAFERSSATLLKFGMGATTALGTATTAVASSLGSALGVGGTKTGFTGVTFHTFVIFACFAFLDPMKKGFLDSAHMHDVLASHDFPLAEEEVQDLIAFALEKTQATQLGPVQFLALLQDVELLE